MANIVLIPNEMSGLNYSIAPSVASNNLTVAIKDAAGNDPTSTSPCVFRVGGNERILSTSLSVVKNAGTNWANLGGAELATQEADLFVYIVWNTNTSALDVLWARIPYATLYSDFSATTTNEKYGAINATAPASTDNVVNIGRFAATLSAGAGYVFSVPTFTSANLVSRPIFETRLLTYTPTWAAAGTAVSLGNATLTGSYKTNNRNVLTRVDFVAGNTTTFGTLFYTWTVPFTAFYNSLGSARIVDSGTAHYIAICGVFATTNTMLGYTPAGTSTIGQLIPITWANADEWRAQIDIEI